MIRQRTHSQALIVPGSRKHMTSFLDYHLDIIQDLADPLRFFYFLLADASHEFLRVPRDSTVRKQEAA